MALKVAFVASEVSPYAKTGGLGDVAGSLPQALRDIGVDVRVIMPYYRRVGRLASARVPVGDRLRRMSLDHAPPGASPDVWFVHGDEYFDRDNLYDYSDDGERFAAFCRGTLELLKASRFRPDVIHCHDWQTGLLPAYLKTLYADDPHFAATASVYTIHNHPYQGLFPPETMPLAGFDWSHFTPEGLEYYGKMSFAKAALLHSDLVSTVSPQYAKEILTSEFGAGLEGVLASRGDKVRGVLNGLDYGVWSPEADPHLARAYDSSSLELREECVRALRQECKLDHPGPVVGMVTRLSEQKGLEIVASSVDSMLKLGTCLVVVGDGEARYVKLLRRLNRRHPGRVAFINAFDEGLAHRIYAGSHFLLMPSLYEPCGLGQLIALRYGCVPVVRTTGGLKDSVRDASMKDGYGFRFDKPDPRSLLAAMKRAVAAFEDPGTYRALQLTGMAQDFSWQRSAQAYLRIYRAARRARRAHERSA